MSIRKVYKIDEHGFYMEDVIINSNESIPSDCVDVPIPDIGLYKPRFVNGKWIETITQEELDSRNQHLPKSEIELLIEGNASLLKRVEESENAIMMLMDMSLL